MREGLEQLTLSHMACAVLTALYRACDTCTLPGHRMSVNWHELPEGASAIGKSLLGASASQIA